MIFLHLYLSKPSLRLCGFIQVFLRFFPSFPYKFLFYFFYISISCVTSQVTIQDGGQLVVSYIFLCSKHVVFTQVFLRFFPLPLTSSYFTFPTFLFPVTSQVTIQDGGQLVVSYIFLCSKHCNLTLYSVLDFSYFGNARKLIIYGRFCVWKQF